MLINLFKLHDGKKDDKPKKWICAKGKALKNEINEIIEELDQSTVSKTALVEYFILKFNISHPTACRLVYLRKEWLPLVFIEELLAISNRKKDWAKIQEKIEFLKCSQPPLKIVKAQKELNEQMCKIAGAHAADGTVKDNYFCVSDGYKSNLDAFSKWFLEVFGLKYEPKSKGKNEWKISTHNKVFCRHLTKIFGFPNGAKTSTVKEPLIIKKSSPDLRKAFAIGALTFEAGFGIGKQVELCVLSKKFRDDLAEILECDGLKFTKMNKKSGKYWRLWSGKLYIEDAEKWMELFEPCTAKWNKLRCYCYGNTKKAGSLKKALKILRKAYPPQPSSKVTVENVLLCVKKMGKAHRYKIAKELIRYKKLDSYGGKWAHSLAPHLNALKRCKIVKSHREKFGRKKSFGSILREVYVFNPNLEEWVLPEF